MDDVHDATRCVCPPMFVGDDCRHESQCGRCASTGTRACRHGTDGRVECVCRQGYLVRSRGTFMHHVYCRARIVNSARSKWRLVRCVVMHVYVRMLVYVWVDNMCVNVVKGIQVWIVLRVCVLYCRHHVIMKRIAHPHPLSHSQYVPIDIRVHSNAEHISTDMSLCVHSIGHGSVHVLVIVPRCVHLHHSLISYEYV